jgi:hypothetical protein
MTEKQKVTLKIQFEFKVEDLWVGVFWKREKHILHIWVCVLPCVPLHVWMFALNDT